MRRRRAPQTPAPARPNPAGLDLAALLDGPRPGRSRPDEDRAWLAGRSAIDRATVGTEYDPRHALRLTARTVQTWRALRFAWLDARPDLWNDNRQEKKHHDC